MELSTGYKSELETQMSNLLINYLLILDERRSLIDVNYDIIMKKVLRSKEKEKDEKTTYLNQN